MDVDLGVQCAEETPALAALAGHLDGARETSAVQSVAAAAWCVRQRLPLLARPPCPRRVLREALQPLNWQRSSPRCCMLWQ